MDHGVIEKGAGYSERAPAEVKILEPGQGHASIGAFESLADEALVLHRAPNTAATIRHFVRELFHARGHEHDGEGSSGGKREEREEGRGERTREARREKRETSKERKKERTEERRENKHGANSFCEFLFVVL